jgi:HK97 gp10 family phage protein
MPSGFSLEVTGLKELATFAQQLATNIKPSLTLALANIFEAGSNRMRSDCPVRTGNLKRSITLNKSASGEILVQINITAKYAGFVNFGTVHMKPRPFASNGYNFILSEMKRINITGSTKATFE